MFYEKLEIKKLILAVDDNSLLESIYNENLRKLEIYDRDNGTDYLNFYGCILSMTAVCRRWRKKHLCTAIQ